MASVEAPGSTQGMIEDSPRFSAEALAVGTAIEDIFRSQSVEVRRELIQPLVNTLTSTEVAGTGLPSDETNQLIALIEENLKGLQQHAAAQKKLEDMLAIPYIGPADDY